MTTMTSPQASSSKYIFWTEEEWRMVALALMKNPKYRRSLPPTIAGADLTEAMTILPEERRRKVPSNNSTSTFRAGLARAYFHIFETMAAPEDEVKAEQESNPDESKKPRIHWRDDEYLALAREIHRISPSSNYHLSTSLAGLTPTEVREAERNVLPLERRRQLTTISAIRPPLIEAFKVIRAELEATQAEAMPEPTPEPEAPPAPAPAPVAVAMPAPEVNAHELALKVLCEMLVPALTDRLAPELAARLGQALMPAAPVAAPVAAPFVPPAAKLPPEPEDDLEFGPPAGWTPPEHGSLVTPAPAVAKKTKIGVLGLREHHVQELRLAFPMYEFMGSHGHMTSKSVQSFLSMDRVINVDNFNNSMEQMADKMLAKGLGDKYTRVRGGLSVVKRQIGLWVNSGVLK